MTAFSSKLRQAVAVCIFGFVSNTIHCHTQVRFSPLCSVGIKDPLLLNLSPSTASVLGDFFIPTNPASPPKTRTTNVALLLIKLISINNLMIIFQNEVRMRLSWQQVSSMSRLHTSKGFTLIELVVGIIILGILAVVAAPRFMNLSQDAHDTRAKAAFAAFNRAVELGK